MSRSCKRRNNKFRVSWSTQSGLAFNSFMIKLVMAERNINEKAKKSGEFLLIIFTYLFNVHLFSFFFGSYLYSLSSSLSSSTQRYFSQLSLFSSFWLSLMIFPLTAHSPSFLELKVALMALPFKSYFTSIECYIPD